MDGISIFPLLILAAMAYMLGRLFGWIPNPSKVYIGSSAPTYFCTTCGATSTGNLDNKGSLLIEIVLWLCFLIPGLIYSIWRRSGRKNACEQCGATTLIPPDSPVAKKMRE